ncbi:MAG: tetratricopeptide repeat protein, partial [Anaerolineales bacterium]|nr:tetratricopeptide repeat protein [Anaerolineales bacterium]
RYQLHLLLRDYARNRLQDETAVERYVHYFLQPAVAESHFSTFADVEQQQIIAALNLALERNLTAALVAGVNAMYPFWESRGLYEIADEWLTQAGRVIDAPDDQPAAMTLHHHWGRLAQRRGEYIQAETEFEAALTIARMLDDKENLSHFLRALGILAARRGDYVLADAYYKEGLGLARALGYGSPVSNFLRGLGVQAYMQGNFARAEAFYEEGLALMSLQDSSEQDPRVMAGRLWGLGFLAREQQDFAQAENYYRRALELTQEMGHLEQVIVLMRSLAGLFWEQADYERSLVFNERAVALARQIGHRWLLARSLRESGEIQLAHEQVDMAKAAFDELYELARIMQSQELIANALYGLARVTAVYNDIPTALKYGRESLDTFIAIGHQQVSDVQAWLESIA